MDIVALLEEARAFNPNSRQELDAFKSKFLGKKGVMNDLFAAMKNVAPEDRKSYGQQINAIKQTAEEKLATFNALFEDSESDHDSALDRTLPGEPMAIGSRHPVSIIRNEILDIFSRIGFVPAEGPEIEDDWHNFTALNFPPEHPARDMQDTF